MAKQVFKAVTIARQDAVRAKSSTPDTLAVGQTLQRPKQQPRYISVHDGLCLPERLPTLLHAPDAVVHPLLTVRSALCYAMPQCAGMIAAETVCAHVLGVLSMSMVALVRARQWNVAGAACNMSCSPALMRQGVARALLTCGTT